MIDRFVLLLGPRAPRLFLLAVVATAAACAGARAITGGGTLPLRRTLRDASHFANISDAKQRSSKLFLEATLVLLHPRCINCHPNGDSPHQGMALGLHEPPVGRGKDDHGVVGMRCGSCHQDRNQPLTRVPGAPKWGVAPLSMAWVGKSARGICEQLKDQKRNGGKTLAQIVEHSAHDELVAWGWSPGAGREPAPGTQKQFGALMDAWMKSGAECPAEGERP